MSHLTADQLSAHLDGALTGVARERAESHLAECDACREALAALASQEEALRPALEHDPGDAYFESFAARVEDRIRAMGREGTQARPARRGFGWLRSPRHLAWTGALAVTVAGAGVVLLTARLEKSDLRSFDDQSRPGIARQAAPQASAPVEDKNETGAATPAPGTPLGAAAQERSAVDRFGENQVQRKQDAKKTEGFARPPFEASPGSPEEEVRVEKQLNAAPQPASGDEAKLLTKDRRDLAAKRLVGTRRTAAGEDVPLQRRESAAAPTPAPDAIKAGAPIPKPPAAPATAAAEKEFASSTSEADRALAPAPTQGLLGPGPGTLCGSVVDGSGHAVARAQVTLVESGATVSTDERGRFCLAASAGVHEIAVMAIGFHSTRLSVRSGAGAPEVAVTLPAVSVLDGAKSLFGQFRDDAAGRGRPQSFAREPADVFSALPDSLRSPVREAQAMVVEGRTRRSAARLDRAAIAWEAAGARLNPGPIEAEARFRLAEARYLAWQLGPGDTRRSDAVAAVRRALEASVQPRQTRSLQAWLAELKP